MSEATAKQSRRELRRAVGSEALTVMLGHQRNLETLRGAVMNLANRADANDRDLFALWDALEQMKTRESFRPHPQTLRERVRWLVFGR